MQKKMLPLGIEDFGKMMQENFYYMCKTKNQKRRILSCTHKKERSISIQLNEQMNL